MGRGRVFYLKKKAAGLFLGVETRPWTRGERWYTQGKSSGSGVKAARWEAVRVRGRTGFVVSERTRLVR